MITLPEKLDETLPPKPGVGSPSYLLDATLTCPTPLFKLAHDWHQATCVRYQPFINMLSFLATFATLAGNKYRTPNSGKLNPYLLILGQTTVGKDNPIRLCKTLMRRLNRKSLVGPSQVGSDAGLLTVMNTSPTTLMFNDEFNFLLKQMSGDKAASYARNIMGVMSEMSNGEDYDGKALKAGADDTVIADPFLSLAFYAQPTGFFELMERGAISQGFFNRMLVYKAAVIRREPFRESLPSPDEALPPELLDYCKAALGDNDVNSKLASWVFPGQNIKGTHKYRLSPAAMLIWKAYHDNDEIVREQLYLAEDEVKLALIGRALQNTYRLACICAWSRSFTDHELQASDVEWAIRMAKISEETYGECPHLTQTSADFEKQQSMISQFIERNPGGVMRSRLTKQFAIKDHVRTDAINNLIRGHVIVAQVTQGRGLRYVHVKYLTKEEIDKLPE